jgi:hypothetical protein
MTDKKQTPEVQLPERAPFGPLMIWGKKGAGKTLAALNSPWLPILDIDTEYSALEYHTNQKDLIEHGYIKAPFERVGVSSYSEFQNTIMEINESSKVYGTIIIDTAGQWGDWVSESVFGGKSDKMTQVLWGDVRKRLRSTLIALQAKSRCLILTAHYREYRGQASPRCNPSVLELASLSVLLERDINNQYPDSKTISQRMPYLPPSIHQYSITRMMHYYQHPADYKNLRPEEKAVVVVEDTNDAEVFDG